MCLWTVAGHWNPRLSSLVTLRQQEALPDTESRVPFAASGVCRASCLPSHLPPSRPDAHRSTLEWETQMLPVWGDTLHHA
ncbi:hypothetical protein GN956_G9986 [Arapaima gigas]